ncbi:MAG: hypothetical protein EAZ97_09345 [Bacteroidetes bacterium]|nr:MAG: hypothetical protein EAZ97_09345 [Bacteroidota bacterium]
MNFLFPSFLFATLLVAIPIIIHFFNFQRAKQVYFTNIEFLKEIKAVSRSKNRLKNILVLIMRCLFIIFLVFAFAQPFLPNENANQIQNSNYVSIYLDNSFSMQNEQGNRNLLDLGIKYSEQITNVFPKNTLFQLLSNGFEGNNNFFFEPSKIKDNLAKLEHSANGRELQNVWKKQTDAFAKNTSEKRNQIFWISDFQKNTVGSLDFLKLDSNNLIYLVPIIGDQVSNLYVDSLWLENPFVKENENNAVFVKINHTGKEAVEEKLVKLFIEDKQVSSSTVSLTPNSSQTLKLNFVVESAGAKACKIQIDDQPVIFDNDYFFSLKVAPPIKITHLTAENTDFIPNVYGNEPFFVLQKFNISAVDYSVLQNSDLVVLQGISEIDNALQEALRAFLRKGKTLIVFPSNNISVKSYSELLNISLSQIAENQTDAMALNVPETQNPFFEGIFDKTSSAISMPKAKPQLSWSSAAFNILTFRNNQPFLSKFYSPLNQNSQIYMFASTLNPTYSEFAKHALFVPVMYKLALSSQAQAENLAYSFSENLAEVSIDSVNKNDLFKLIKIGEGQNNEFIPIQRMNEQKLTLDIPKIGLSAGNYKIVKKENNQIVGLIALNYNKSESLFESYDAETLRTLIGKQKNIQIFETLDANNFANEFQEKNIAKNLWREMLILALLALLTEILLLRFWKNT